MKKLIIIATTVIAVAIIGIVGYALYKDSQRTFPTEQTTEQLTFAGLDHDIYVPNVSEICDTQITGFDVYVGPTGWPFGNKVMWEVALYEDANNYYARLIYHEYILWMSFDYPYIACKIPKANVSGDLRTNEKLRWQVLWDITYTTERSYNYKPYMPNAVVQTINGHTVTFGKYGCKYEKYFVICDESNKW